MYNFRGTKNRKIGLFGVRIHPFWLKIRPGKAHDLPDLNFMLIGPTKPQNEEKQPKEKSENTKTKMYKIGGGGVGGPPTPLRGGDPKSFQNPLNV